MIALSGSCEDYGEVIEIGPVVDTMLACEVAIIFLGVVGVCLVGHALEIHEAVRRRRYCGSAFRCFPDTQC